MSQYLHTNTEVPHVTVHKVHLHFPQGAWLTWTSSKLTGMSSFISSSENSWLLSTTFDLNTAPRVFARLTEVVVTSFTKQGVDTHFHLDEWMITGQSELDTSRIISYATGTGHDMLFLFSLSKFQLISW